MNRRMKDLSEREKYDYAMETLRAKLKDHPHSGNRGEAYKEGIRCAMSKIKEVWGDCEDAPAE